MKANTWKALLSTAFAALVSYAGQLAVPVIVLFTIVVADYLTGMLRAYLTRSLSSRRGFLGILKKLCYFVIIGVGAGADWLLKFTADTFSFPYDFPCAVALLVTVWLIINELISILENLRGIGVPLPGFLVRLIGRLKESADNAAKTDRS